jgi:hypothetical protein
VPRLRCGEADSAAAPLSLAHHTEAEPALSAGDDDVLAAILIRMWALASGRILRSDVRPEQLSEEELIGFWADDLTAASGRHAAATAVAR